MSTGFTLPDVQGRSPIPVSRKTPVLYIFNPIAEPSFSDGLRNPVYGVVILDQFILHGGHLDEPALPCIVNKRGIAAPAVRITMCKFGRIKEQSPLFQVLQHFRIGTHRAFLHLFFRRFTTHSAKRGFFGQLSFTVYKFHKSKIICSPDSSVILTESRRNMNDTGTVFRTDIIIGNHDTGFLMLFLRFLFRPGVKRFIRKTHEIFSFTGLQNLVGFFPLFCKTGEHGIKTRHCQNVEIPVCRLHLRILQIGMDTKRHVRRKRPGCRRPGKEIAFLPLHLKAYDSRTLRNLFIPLGNFVRRERRSATGTIRYHFKALIQELPLPDFFQCPPLGFNKIIMIGYIRVFHIRPEANFVGEIFPHSLILPNIFFT